MAAIVFDHVRKVYGDGTEAVQDLSLEVEDGNLLVLVGPSGCGKTTALRMVAGLEEVTSGRISIGGRVVNDLPPRKRDIAMVFQNYALYPHMTAYDNMAFGLKLRRMSKDQIDRRVRSAAETLGLFDDQLRKKPNALSGGQKQRVAMGRSIVRQPQAFLMDEPLSNLDAKLRVQMRTDIAKVQQDLQVTTLYVTHDQTEAMTMGDQVAVMRGGELQQVAPPKEIYEHPVNLFVAGFIGSPAMCLIEATVHFDGEAAEVRFGSSRLRLDPRLLAERPALRAYEGSAIAIGIRPEDVHEPTEADGDDGRVQGVVELREELGSEVLVYLGIEAIPVLTDDTRELAEEQEVDARVIEEATKSRSVRMAARFDKSSQVREYQRLEVAVDTNALHLFDLSTGNEIRTEELRAPISSVTPGL